MQYEESSSCSLTLGFEAKNYGTARTVHPGPSISINYLHLPSEVNLCFSGIAKNTTATVELTAGPPLCQRTLAIEFKSVLTPVLCSDTVSQPAQEIKSDCSGWEPCIIRLHKLSQFLFSYQTTCHEWVSSMSCPDCMIN